MLEYKIYILKSCKTGRYYVGMTNDLNSRVKRHNKGQNPSTKSGRPWRLVYIEEQPDRKSAWLRERQIKRYRSGEAFKKLITE